MNYCTGRRQLRRFEPEGVGRQAIERKIKRAFQKLLPPVSCAVAVGWGEENPSSLDPAERAFTFSMVPRRAGFFTAGRRRARMAIRSLGGDDFPILCHDDGAPVWPGPWKGSLSHSGEWSVAVVSCEPALAGIGIDLQEIEYPFPVEIEELIFDPTERAMIAPLDARCRFLLFSAKEATFKAFRHAVGQPLSWDDISVEANFDRGIFLADGRVEGVGLFAIYGRVAVAAGFALTVCALFSDLERFANR